MTAPQYPRAQPLTQAEQAVVDAGLAGVGAVIRDRTGRGI